MSHPYGLEQMNQAKIQDIHRDAANIHLAKEAQTDKPSLFTKLRDGIAQFGIVQLAGKMMTQEMPVPVQQKTYIPTKLQTQEISI